jgi:hypothetical protein
MLDELAPSLRPQRVHELEAKLRSPSEQIPLSVEFDLLVPAISAALKGRLVSIRSGENLNGTF